MIRTVSLILVSVAVLSTAEQIPINTCSYLDQADGPSSADLKKTDNGYELEVKFWANQIGPNSPLKVRKQEGEYNVFTRLIHVLYPIKTPSTDSKYTEHTIILPIPKTEINSDKMVLSLHKVGDDGKETTVWCMMASTRVLNGLKEEVTTMHPFIHSYAPVPLINNNNNESVPS